MAGKKSKAKAARSAGKKKNAAGKLRGGEARKALAAAEARIAALEAELAAAGAATSATAVSPLAPARFPDLPPIDGVRFAAAGAGVRYRGRLDVMLAELAPGTAVTGVFTRSATRSAPVLWCERLANGPAPKGAQAILVNSGNANAFTGADGEASVAALARAVSAASGAPQKGVWMASTGVIGETLPHDRIAARLDALVAGLAPDGAAEAAQAIMTTDTFAKGATATVDLGGTTVTIAGFAKGSGMIAPDMATMLGFIFTDAAIDRNALRRMLRAAADDSFNAITVDGDTSTSDTVLLAATGRADMAQIKSLRDPRAAAFRAALGAVMLDLAQQIVRDGEGASKLVRIETTSAASDRAARRVALAIANSPLVKTAIAGEDPNWGRVVMAVGKAGEKADRDRLTIRFGDIVVAENGRVAAGYDEAAGAAYMKRPELDLSVDLGVGAGRAQVWTCDLTHRYVSINADYRS